MTYATPSDVEVEIGRPAISEAETAQIQGWIERVERAIARRFVRIGLTLDEQVSLNTPSANEVRDVEVAAVARKIENPNGITSVTRSVDDASVTTRREGSVSSGDALTLTDDEWAALLPAPSVAARVFSVMPS